MREEAESRPSNVSDVSVCEATDDGKMMDAGWASLTRPVWQQEAGYVKLPLGGRVVRSGSGESVDDVKTTEEVPSHKEWKEQTNVKCEWEGRPSHPRPRVEVIWACHVPVIGDRRLPEGGSRFFLSLRPSCLVWGHEHCTSPTDTGSVRCWAAGQATPSLWAPVSLSLKWIKYWAVVKI